MVPVLLGSMALPPYGKLVAWSPKITMIAKAWRLAISGIDLLAIFPRSLDDSTWQPFLPHHFLMVHSLHVHPAQNCCWRTFGLFAAQIPCFTGKVPINLGLVQILISFGKSCPNSFRQFHHPISRIEVPWFLPAATTPGRFRRDPVWESRLRHEWIFWFRVTWKEMEKSGRWLEIS